MSKPSLNHVSVIKRSQISKRCRNASIFGVSSFVYGFSNFFVVRPFKKSFCLCDPLIDSLVWYLYTDHGSRSCRSVCKMLYVTFSSAVIFILRHKLCFENSSCKLLLFNNSTNLSWAMAGVWSP